MGADDVDVATTFGALGDPVRRAIVERLVTGEATVNELAELFPISLQAVSKHIKVLEAARVVTRRREGRTRPVVLDPSTLDMASGWIEAHRRRLQAKHERLDELLESMKGRP